VPPADHLTEFFLTALVILVIPGPSVLFVISRGVAYGRRTALMTVLGNSTGALLQMLLVALGLGAIVERSLLAYNAVKLVGAAYLIYLGVQAFRHRHAVATAAIDGAPPKSTRRIFREGFVVGVTNPKVIVFASAALPQFVDRSRGHVPLQMIILAVMFQVLATASDGTYGLLAGTARSWFARSPKRLSMLSGAGGLAIVGVGLNLAVSRRHD
jgi:threonine/homoserine/homoserine lactone efflux protein